MGVISKVLNLFGLGKKTELATEKTPLQQLQDKLNQTLPEDRPAVITKAWEDAKLVLDTLKSFDTEPPADALGYMDRVCRNFDILVYLYGVQKSKDGSVEWKKGIDEDYEKLLEILPQRLLPLTKTKTTVLEEVEQYITQKEDGIFLKEASGDYTIRISENQKWVAWPFAQDESRGKSRIVTLRQELAQHFVPCTSLSAIEFSERVPFVDISFLELKNLNFEKAVNVFEPKENKYYTYFV